MDQLLSFQIIKIIQETSDARTYLMMEKDSKEVIFESGQFLTFTLMIDGEEVRRSYSISTAPNELPIIGITMKLSENGFATNFLIENLREGDILCAFPPIGEFRLSNANNAKEIFLIGAGTGITPLISILKDSLPNQNLKMNLLYSNRNEHSIIFKDELKKLQREHPDNFSVYHILSQPDTKWEGMKGRINKKFILDFFKNRNIKDAHFYLCGPPGMMIDIISALKHFEIKPDQIHQEYFKVIVLHNAEVDEDEIKQRTVTILFNGKEHKIPVNPNCSILDSALENGLEIPNSCRIGQCTSCKAKLISGKINLVDQTALSEREIELGYCLTCVGFPLSDDIVIDYDLP